jgi:hypothetical protein
VGYSPAMLRITNIAITERAAEVLDRLRVTFRPQQPGDVFALAYLSSFTEVDGTSVAGFRPGYIVHSLSPTGLATMYALAQPPGAPEFYFMPKFDWRADEQYLIDLASEKLETFSIGPMTKWIGD